MSEQLSEIQISVLYNSNWIILIEYYPIHFPKRKYDDAKKLERVK